MSEAVEQVRASLSHARDAQVTRVVAVVDAMPQRGNADALIAPLRSRLAQLRPMRPPNFNRLLFTPLNSVIVTLAEWRQCGIGVPRPALAPLGRAVRAALARHGPEWSGTAFTPELGQTLWPAAATALDTMAMPPDWTGETGLTEADFPAIASAAASVLHCATEIEPLATRHRPADEDTVRDIVFSSRARGVGAMDTMVCVLLARLPAPAQIAAMLTGMPGGERAVRQALDRLDASLASHARIGTDLKEVAWQAARVAVMLTTLEASATAERRVQLNQVRREAEARCRGSFDQAIHQTLALLDATHGGTPADDAVAAMEAAARDARRLEAASARLGANEAYQTARLEAAANIRDHAASLTQADRVRLIEILAGPEEALTLLKQR